MENSSSSLGLNISTAPYLDDDYMIVATDKYADFRKQAEFAFFIVSIALSPVTIVGNLLVHISMYKFRNLRTVTNMFIGSLALADCFLGFVVLPFYALFYSDRTCKVQVFMSVEIFDGVGLHDWIPLQFSCHISG